MPASKESEGNFPAVLGESPLDDSPVIPRGARSGATCSTRTSLAVRTWSSKRSAAFLRGSSSDLEATVSG